MWANSEAEARTFIEDALRKIEDAAREELRQYESTGPRKRRGMVPGPPKSAMSAGWQLRYAERIREAINSTSAATWPAFYGFLLGLEVNRWPIDKRDDLVRALEPLATWAQRQRPTRVDGGKATRRAPPDEDISAAILERQRKCPRDSWTAVCQKVAEDLGFSRNCISGHASSVRRLFEKNRKDAVNR